ICEANAPRIEGIGFGKGGADAQRDLLAEAAIAEVGPVADLAIAGAHDVDQSVATHVGELNRLRAVDEHDARALLFVFRFAEDLWCSKTLGAEGTVPDEAIVFADEDVGPTVAV